MKKYGFLLPDGTAFYPGMGRELYEQSTILKKVFKRIRFLAGFNLKDILYDESGHNWTAQERDVAVLIFSTVVYRLWRRKADTDPDFFCGRGAGYLGALVCAGKLPLWYAVLRARKGKTTAPFFIRHTDKVIDLGEQDSGCLPEQSDCLIAVLSSEADRSQKVSGMTICLDDPQDGTAICESLKKHKTGNYLYAAKRLNGIAAACENHSQNSETYTVLDESFEKLTDQIQIARRRELQDEYAAAGNRPVGGEQETGSGKCFTEEEFRACAEELKKILELKEVTVAEVSGQLKKLQKETAIKMERYFAEWI